MHIDISCSCVCNETICDYLCICLDVWCSHCPNLPLDCLTKMIAFLSFNVCVLAVSIFAVYAVVSCAIDMQGHCYYFSCVLFQFQFFCCLLFAAAPHGFAFFLPLVINNSESLNSSQMYSSSTGMLVLLFFLFMASIVLMLSGMKWKFPITFYLPSNPKFYYSSVK